MTTFRDLGVPEGLVTALARRGITAPFPIQTATLADGLAGRDLCGRAPTGSGKTLAFAVPVAVRAGAGGPRRPSALILVPTRELASQVAEELRPLAAAAGRSVATFYGGTSVSRDQRALRRGVDIAVACPGRLADLVQRGDADLRAVRLVVLDEADRMADMGFLPEVRRLLDMTTRDRQTLLFSATLDGDVDVLVRRYQRDPVRHELAAPAEERGAVRHFFWHAEPSQRVAMARDVVSSAAPAIVFTRTKHAADRVARQLGKLGVAAAAIHGNRTQRQRERALADFGAGRVSALVATDVAARGIHVDNVGVVVHFDPPATGKDYVHRSGRTGRAGADGLVVTFVAPDKVHDVHGLQRGLAMRQHVEAMAVRQLGTTGGGQQAGAEPQPRSRPQNGAPHAGGQPRARHNGGPPRRRRSGRGAQGGQPQGRRTRR
jgi:superfamily II DNA/RNA helicase